MDIEQKAFERLRFAAETSEQYYERPLIICYSGGKDSDVLLELAIRSGISFEVLHNHTTADAPETVYYIRSKFSFLEDRGITCNIEYPVYKGKRTSMWDLIVQKGMPPTRLMRYCCSVLKEGGGRNRAIATGVRWAESTARRKNRGLYEDINRNKDKRIILNNDNDDKRRLFERCQKQASTVTNPIIDWSNEEVADYICSEKIITNPLYQCGFSRVGCVGCPMAGKRRYREFAKYSEYEAMYIRAFDRMLTNLKKKNRDTQWKSGQDVFRWWMEEDFRQVRFEDLEGLEIEDE